MRRIITATAHPSVEDWAGDKPRLLLLNQHDRISAADKQRWASHFSAVGTRVFWTNGHSSGLRSIEKYVSFFVIGSTRGGCGSYRNTMPRWPWAYTSSTRSDEAIFMFTRKPPYIAVPGQDAPFTVRLGWSPDNVVVTGVYLFQRVHLFGAPRRGQQIHYVCRAADLANYLKRVDSQHFDKENGHETLGDVFQTLFKGSGKEVVVHPDIASKEVSGGYMLRWN